MPKIKAGVANAFPVNTHYRAKDALLANRGRVICQVRQTPGFVDGVNKVILPTAVERHVLRAAQESTRRKHVSPFVWNVHPELPGMYQPELPGMD